jgi:hypothetical protein
VITEEKRKVLELFAQGRRQYKIMQFQEALKCFGEALKIDQNDGPSKVYSAASTIWTIRPRKTGTGSSS